MGGEDEGEPPDGDVESLDSYAEARGLPSRSAVLHRAVRLRGGLVSNDGATITAARLGRGVVTVVPVTSNLDQVYPFSIELSAKATGLPIDSKAQAEQVGR